MTIKLYEKHVSFGFLMSVFMAQSRPDFYFVSVRGSCLLSRRHWMSRYVLSERWPDLIIRTKNAQTHAEVSHSRHPFSQSDIIYVPIPAGYQVTTGPWALQSNIRCDPIKMCLFFARALLAF